MGLWHTHGSPNLVQNTKPYINQQKRENLQNVEFAVPADYRVKLKECENRDKYFELARELKKLWNIKVTIIPIVIGALGTVTKTLVQGLEDLEITERVKNV